MTLRVPTIEDLLIASQPPRKAQPTPGPWQQYSSEHDPFTIIGNVDGLDDGRFHFTEVCIVNDGMDDQREANANARLIAAAPELLLALKVCLEAIGTYHADPEAGLPSKGWHWWQAARDIFKKAGGEFEP